MTRLSVVVTTYEWPEALDAVLRALTRQLDPDFDVVVADDGSGPATRAVVERFRGHFGDRIAYIRQEDEGFRVGRARNLGALAAAGDYLVFLDGDCVPRRSFTVAMRASIRPGWFVAGRRVQLSQELGTRVLSGEIDVASRSAMHWLLGGRRHADGLWVLTRRDRRRVGQDRHPDFEPPDRAYGPGLGVARTDFERVNGYDLRFEGWGEEDVDLATRLRRLGLRCGHAGPGAALLHLWHESRMHPERANWLLLQETEAGDRVESVRGLRELALEVERPSALLSRQDR